MKVEIGNITKAMSKISAFAANEKTATSLMLDIRDDTLRLCYTNGRKSVIEIVDIETEEGDIKDKIVVNYDIFNSIISACQPTGSIFVREIKMEFTDKANKIINVKAEKMIAEVESEDDEIEYRVISVFEQSISWVKHDENQKVARLSRKNYDAIFNKDNIDVWDIEELRKILTNLSIEKGKRIYVSPKNNCAFVSNTSYMGSMPLEKEIDRSTDEDEAKSKYKYAVVVDTSTAREVADILSKIDADIDEIYMHVEEYKFWHLFTPDGRVGISVDMVDADKNHLKMLKIYQDKGYKNYQITMNKEVFLNIIKSAIDAGKMDKTVLKFGAFSGENDTVAIKLTSSDSNASIKNNYTVACSGCVDVNGDIDKLELPISLKVTYEILNLLEEDYIALDVHMDEQGIKLRISDIDMSLRNMLDMEKEVEDEDVSSTEFELKNRSKYLTTKYYCVSRKE